MPIPSSLVELLRFRSHATDPSSRIPSDGRFDSTLTLAREGYEFIVNGCRRHASDVFETRLLLQPTICMRGADAARLFYDESKFVRADATPRRLRKTLLGEGGVHGLDGEAHRIRKRMFMSLMTPERIDAFADRLAIEWRTAIPLWERAERIVLLDEVEQLLCRAACKWSGVPLEPHDVRPRTADLAALMEGAGGTGIRHWRGRAARQRADAWIARLVHLVRAYELDVPESCALASIAWHRDPDGELLPPRVAAVEVLDVLRPIVAVARFVAFTALALHEHPSWRERIARGENGDTERFVHEVRRFYPFVPFVPARVRRDFEWRGYRFVEGTRALLDLYGTNHDPRAWDEPDRFAPDRFRQWGESPFDFVPQGGGDHHANHRCAGEWLTIAIMTTAADLLTRAMTYEVPTQDLRVSLTRIPAQPKSRVVVAKVRRAP